MRYVLPSAIGLRQIDLLSRAKDRALPGLYISGYSPQPQSDTERVDAKQGPEGKLANPMLFRVTGRAERNRVAIARFHPYTAIGSSPHVRGLRWRGFTAGDAGELPDKSQMPDLPVQVRLRLVARYAARDARSGHRSKELRAYSRSDTLQHGWFKPRSGHSKWKKCSFSFTRQSPDWLAARPSTPISLAGPAPRTWRGSSP